MKLPETDIELVSKLQTGNTDAFDTIYKRYAGKLYLFGLKYIGSVTETEEFIQTIFLKIWENRKNLNKDLSFKSYLFTIAYNDICKHFRNRNYQKQFIKDTFSDTEPATSDTVESIDFKSILNRVEQLLDTLPEKQKLIFIKSKFDGMSTKEIAKELKLAPGTIDNYISDTLKFLKIRIQKEDLMIVLFVSLFIF